MAYVYFVREGSSDYFKIGMTKREKNGRLSGLQTGNARDLKLYAYIECKDFKVSRLESKIHSELTKFNVRNEWFQLKEEFLNRLVLNLGGVINTKDDFVLLPRSTSFIFINSKELKRSLFPLFLVWSLVFPAILYILFLICKFALVLFNLYKL